MHHTAAPKQGKPPPIVELEAATRSAVRCSAYDSTYVALSSAVLQLEQKLLFVAGAGEAADLGAGTSAAGVIDSSYLLAGPGASWRCPEDVQIYADSDAVDGETNQNMSDAEEDDEENVQSQRSLQRNVPKSARVIAVNGDDADE